MLADVEACVFVLRIDPEADEFVDHLQQDIGDDPAVDTGKENGLGLVEKLRGAPGQRNRLAAGLEGVEQRRIDLAIARKPSSSIPTMLPIQWTPNTSSESSYLKKALSLVTER